MTKNNDRIPRRILALCALAGLFAFANPAVGQVQNEILSVTPSSAAQGASDLTVTFALDTDLPPPPPAEVIPDSATIGTLSGTSLAHPSQYEVTAVFTIPAGETIGAKDATVAFSGPSGTITFAQSGGFTVTADTDSPPSITGQPQSRSVAAGATVTFSVTATGSAPLSYRWQQNSANVTGATNASYVIHSAVEGDAGNYRCIVTNAYGSATSSLAVLSVSTNIAGFAADTAADAAYDAGWTDASNGGSGFGAWQLTVGGNGGHFTGASTGNAGGSSGGIDTGGRSWGLWSTNGVAEAIRSFAGDALSTSQIFTVDFDNGYIDADRSAGVALRNAAGENLWEFYFTGGNSTYTIGDSQGQRATSIPYTGDGLSIEVQPKGSGSYVARLIDTSGRTNYYQGTFITQTDMDAAQVRVWNYEAGAGSDFDLYVNRLEIAEGTLTYVAPEVPSYVIPDTGQTDSYDEDGNIITPAPGGAFYGQDAHYDGIQPAFQDNGDGTVTDLNTGLEWQQTPPSSDYGWSDASTYCDTLVFAGHDDWRLPTLKELFAIGDFSEGWPYLNETYFDIAGTTVSKDEQFWAQENYVGVSVESGSDGAFGVNHGTGHIKVYPSGVGPGGGKRVRAVRGQLTALNDFQVNGDGTITDNATGLMWAQADNGTGLLWSNALAYAETSELAGHADWRLPNIKELQSIVDYSYSPTATDPAQVGPAIDPIFSCTPITNEAGNADYAYYWSSTSARFEAGGNFYYAWYVAFGMAVNGEGEDFHGAGAVRFDTKALDGPAGEDAERYYNYIRLVRDVDTDSEDAAPSITGQPQSQTVNPGDPASFVVTASGTEPITYQWQKDALNLTGETNASVSILSAVTGDAGGYRCIVANSIGATTSSVATLTVYTGEAPSASDSAADSAYDSGWADGSNGGTGFNAWQLTAPEAGGHFTGASTGNAGGSSGGIDTSGRSWGLWSTNEVTEAVRSWTGSAMAIGQIFSADFDNGYMATDRSVGMALQNGAGENLLEFYFSGGENRYSIQDGNGTKSAPMNFTGDGFTLEVERTGTATYRARITESSGNERWFLGTLMAQTDQGIARVRFWNYEAGTDSDSDFFINSLSITSGSLEPPTPSGPFPIVDTGQTGCYGDTDDITPPAPGETFAGQDGQYAGLSPSFTLSADGLTVLDNRTGLTWRRTPDLDDDGDIDVNDKLTWAEVQTYADAINSGGYGGYSDWRVPSIKEQFSLIDFRGLDPNVEGTDTSGLTPFIDTGFFDFAYGDTAAGERVIDSQYASTNVYVANDRTLFGVNFADGRIKGYGMSGPDGSEKTFLVVVCRGNTEYGKNDFIDNGDGTIGDAATGLTWQQNDSLVGMNWADALAYAEGLELGGYKDWRLPNVKELQALMDYSRSPDTTSSAAIDALFNCSSITNMNGVTDYAFYWSGTTHLTFDGTDDMASYACFGRGLGTVDQGASIIDIHGAGCQRSDPKDGDPGDYPNSGNGPQGDVARVFNHVRCVRGGVAVPPAADTDEDGLTDWYEYNYTGSVTGMSPTGDLDSDGYPNGDEDGAGTSPSDSGSLLEMEEISWTGTTNRVIRWQSVLGKTYRIQRSTNLLTDAFSATVATGIAATPPVNTVTDTTDRAESSYYRISVE